MDDDRAGELIDQVLTVAVLLREEPDAVAPALAAVDDPTSALVVAAALIDIDRPINTWWQRSRPLGACARCREAPCVGRSPYCEECRLAVRRRSWRNAARRRRTGMSTHRAGSL
ncbi:MAG: hypothetical protein HYR62_01995 [Actinobacteria bacterium]|nr:hypothetical protein [Actinomycetota bacterium]MBI3687255.1 hypothetical protein [Actinomycetota bacterium]